MSPSISEAVTRPHGERARLSARGARSTGRTRAATLGAIVATLGAIVAVLGAIIAVLGTIVAVLAMRLYYSWPRSHGRAGQPRTAHMAATLRAVAPTLLATAVCVVALVLPDSAAAVGGRYTVSACTGGSGTGVNNIFGAWSSFDGAETLTCASGVGIQTRLTNPNTLEFYHGGATYIPVASNTIVAMSMWMFTSVAGNAYSTQVVANPYGFTGVQTNLYTWFSGATFGTNYGWVQIVNNSLSAGSVGVFIFCGNFPNCSGVYAYSNWSDIFFTVRDDADPTISPVSGSLLPGAFGPDYRRGSQSATWQGNDSTGIRRTEAWLFDGTWQVPSGTHVIYACNYTFRSPCSNQTATHSVNTALYSNGAHALTLRAWDAANMTGYGAADNGGVWGNYGDYSDTIYIDNTSPVAPGTTSDSGGADQEWATSATTLTANWTTGSDAHSGVNDYEYCFSLLTNCGSTISETGFVAGTTRTTGAVTLAQGTRYFSCARTRDSALDNAGNPGNVSGWICSNGQRVDSVAPNAVTVSDGPGADIGFISSTTSVQANWTASGDGTSGLSRYDYCVTTSAAGADCAGGAVWAWTGNALTTSITAGGLTLTNGALYYVCVRSVDVASNTRVDCSNGQRVDVTAPSVPTFVSPPDNIGIAVWPALTMTYIDPAPATNGRILYQLCADAACTALITSGTSSSTNIATGANGTWTPTDPNGTYYWRARGQDGAGNIGPWSTTRLIIVGNSSISITVDSPTQSLGLQVPGTNSTASTIVTVSTNAANGYQLQASDPSDSWGLDQPAVATVPDWTPGTVAVPSYWAPGTSGYFGITVRDATGGRMAKWGAGTGWPANDYTNNLYAGLTTTAQIIHQRATYNTATETITVTYRTNISALQTAGGYTTTATYTIVGIP